MEVRQLADQLIANLSKQFEQSRVFAQGQINGIQLLIKSIDDAEVAAQAAKSAEADANDKVKSNGPSAVVK